MQKDGDLWELLHETIKAKGPHTFLATKVKGHATDQMVAENEVKPEDKIGNDHADNVANEGVNMYRKDVLALGANLTKRHIAYSKFLKTLHDSFLYAILKRNKLLTQKGGDSRPGKEAGNDKMIDFAMPEEGKTEDQSQVFIKTMIDIGQFADTMKKHHRAKEVQGFLASTSYRKVEAGEQGISWLELYTLYKLTGEKCMVGDEVDKTQPKPALRNQLRAFKNTVRTIARLTMEHSDAEMFRASTNKKPRLKGLGIVSHAAMINCQIDIDSTTRKDIATHILRSQARMSQKKVKDILEQRQQVKLQKMVLANKNKWSSEIKATREAAQLYKGNKVKSDLKRKNDEVLDSEAKRLREGESEARPEQTAGPALFICSICDHKVPATRKAFSIGTLDAKTWCGKCKKNRMSKEFQCQCGRPWYKCEFHKDLQSEAELIELMSESKVISQTTTKRKLTSHVDLEDFYRVKKRRTKAAEPALRQGMLSEKLKVKFAALFK